MELKHLGENIEHLTEGLPMFNTTKSMAYALNSTDAKAENVQLFINNCWRS